MIKTQKLSIVIPIYNDEEVLQELYRRLKPVVSTLSNSYEIVLVDDGSKDKSWEIILSFEKNKSFNKQAWMEILNGLTYNFNNEIIEAIKES